MDKSKEDLAATFETSFARVPHEQVTVSGWRSIVVGRFVIVDTSPPAMDVHGRTGASAAEGEREKAIADAERKRKRAVVEALDADEPGEPVSGQP